MKFTVNFMKFEFELSEVNCKLCKVTMRPDGKKRSLALGSRCAAVACCRRGKRPACVILFFSGIGVRCLAVLFWGVFFFFGRGFVSESQPSGSPVGLAGVSWAYALDFWCRADGELAERRVTLTS